MPNTLGLKLWQRISALGQVKSRRTDVAIKQSRTVALTNQISVVLMGIFMLVVITDVVLLGHFDHATLRFLSGLLICLLALILNAQRWHNLSRFTLILSVPTVLVIWPGLVGRTHEVSILWVPTASVVYTVLPYLLFSWPQERTSFLIAQGFLLALCIWGDQLLLLGAEPDSPIHQIIDRHYIPFKRSIIALWVFLHLPMIYFLRRMRHYKDRLEASHREIQEKKDEILTQNEELRAHQEQITHINGQLEQLVHDRTLELERQNHQLAEYAFVNSHLLRAPLARIQGLVYLLERTGQVTAEDLVYAHLKDAVDEFNQIVAKINALVEEGNHFSRQDFALPTAKGNSLNSEDQG